MLSFLQIAWRFSSSHKNSPHIAHRKQRTGFKDSELLRVEVCINLAHHATFTSNITPSPYSQPSLTGKVCLNFRYLCLDFHTRFSLGTIHVFTGHTYIVLHFPGNGQERNAIRLIFEQTVVIKRYYRHTEYLRTYQSKLLRHVKYMLIMDIQAVSCFFGFKQDSESHLISTPLQRSYL